MTVADLEDSMTFEELVSWSEFYGLERKAQEKAHKEAKDKAKANRGPARRGRRR